MKDKRTGRSRSQEIAAVAVMAFAFFLFLCLISYSPEDPSFGNRSLIRGDVHNFGGIVGAYTSDMFLRFLGMSAAWIPIVLLMLSFKLFMREDFRVGLAGSAGFAGLIVSTSGILSLALINFRIMGTEYPTGGFLGASVIGFLTPFLNTAGTGILLAAIFVISLIVTADLSFAAFIINTARYTRAAFARIRESFQKRAEKAKRRRQLDREMKQKETSPPPVIVEEAVVQERKPRKKKEGAAASLFEIPEASADFQLPPLTLLEDLKRKDTRIKKDSLLMNARILEKKLADFSVEGKVVEVKPGPLITVYELEPAPGVKINRITALADDLAMALKAPSVRIAPVAGKSVVGIEIPNHERDPVHLRNVLDNEDFPGGKYRLPIALGEDTVGTPVIADLVRMPHLLIAGTTGSGKSVSLNAMICSILFKAAPDEVKFLMIDPKRLELSAYEGIPHLLHPVVVNPKDASQVLRWAVLEMERRYRIISEVGAKNIEKFNKLAETAPGKGDDARRRVEQEEAGEGDKAPAAVMSAQGKMPYVVIIIDELADLMMAAQRNVEESLTRLAQMARAAGIHLILATQRPSVDVITGIIKANFPTRISFQVSSKVDSRTILDQLGAEHLLGMGDMLFLPPGVSRLQRIHGAFVSDKEIERVVQFIKKQARPAYDESILEVRTEQAEAGGSEQDYDEKYDDAVELVTDLGQASISLVQRYMKIGYNRAARIIERMEAEGVVGPSDGVKPRKVLAKKLSR
ncbi:MAG TPA: DNA translocase FtsK 4TM domain-containing protein [Syntrophales bacterium]|nr:DNA translocase FtsK 4TM domain-containing protein [Syntrophales bacterium]